uniref:Uncharacterized protein n=1 Tax=Rhizophora mucronata TaxID=61149 RepID=A0A2P2PBM4_RHIMU
MSLYPDHKIVKNNNCNFKCHITSRIPILSSQR